jgi:hypothetical protein
MKQIWLLAALLSLACSGNTAGDGEDRAELDACSEGDTSACDVDGAPGTRTCQIGEHGFVWGACNLPQAQPDQCRPGDVMHCFAEGSAMRSQFGDMTASCEQIDGRWAYPTHACATPLVFSFDHRPVDFTQAEGEFDLFGQGMSIGTDWVSAATPWLVLDRNHDGNIADGSELFGSMTVLPSGERAQDGFAALAALDADRDGWITPRDPGFAQLQLWSDTDQNRRSSASELSPLTAAKIDAIELAYRRVPRCETSGCELERARFTFHDADGATRTGAVIDVHLRGF